jgi:hypothetical protein
MKIFERNLMRDFKMNEQEAIRVGKYIREKIKNTKIETIKNTSESNFIFKNKLKEDK